MIGTELKAVNGLLIRRSPSRRADLLSHEHLACARELCDDLDHFYVTAAAERFAKVAARFLGSAPSVLEGR